ncbi:MAG: topA [Gammaproteobacteria bacterium]|jgi:DNA topoisomerase-1|nr:topA [Gammaproteobacteria bacterium]
MAQKRDSGPAATQPEPQPEPQPESLRAAAAEGLLFTSDRDPGIRRMRRGRGFVYLHADGRKVADEAHLARIRSLAIPPAYRDVWICASARGHLQATGHDARGRKQYRYHARWRSHRDAQKFDHILEFGRALPRIRRRVAQDLRKTGLPRERVLATVVKLLDATLVRVGNEEYARANGSFGLTTLRNRHVNVTGDTLNFEFRGKSGIVHRVTVSDPALARIVRRCADIPGQELFQWIDAEGERHRVDSNDVNEYLREASGGSFTAKDFRTWFATIEALATLRKHPVGTHREVKRKLNEVIAAVAARLGNTPTICRKCYIHPQVLEAYAAGQLLTLNGAAPQVVLRTLLRRRSRASRQQATRPRHRRIVQNRHSSNPFA